MKPFLFAIAFLSSLLLSSQNLIPNPSFEDTVSRVVDFFGSNKLLRAQKWYSPADGSPDFFHPDSYDPLSDTLFKVPINFEGNQNSFHGKAYQGVVIYSTTNENFREYLQTQLLDVLKKDSLYCFTAYISLSDSSNYAVKNNLGIYFSAQKDSSDSDTALNLKPQIEFVDDTFLTNKINWIKLEGRYKAKGDERYLTIGNFDNDTRTDTYYIGGGGRLFTQQNCYYYIDYLQLIPCDTAVSLEEVSLLGQIRLYPNPIQEQMLLQYSGERPLQFQLMNLQGQWLPVKFEGNSSQYRFEMAHLPPGIYFLQISDGIRQSSLKILKQ